MSKRTLGLQIQEAVLTSLTALSRSASSITQKNVDSAVDYVFEQASLVAVLDIAKSLIRVAYLFSMQVFGSSFVDANLLDIDDFI